MPKKNTQTYKGYEIELVEENNENTYPFKIGINGVFNNGYAPSIENGFALGKEFVNSIIKISNGEKQKNKPDLSRFKIAKSVITWRVLYKILGYAPTTYSSNKLPTKHEAEIIKLLIYINEWVENINKLNSK